MSTVPSQPRAQLAAAPTKVTTCGALSSERGLSVEGSMVAAVDMSSFHVQTTSTAGGGRFCFSLSPGTYTFTATHADGTAYVAPTEVGNPSVEVAMRMSPPGATLTARITNDGGAGIPGLLVAFRRELPPGQWYVARTDAGGAVSVSPPIASYAVTLVPPEWLSTPAHVSSRSPSTRVSALSVAQAERLSAPSLDRVRAGMHVLNAGGVGRLAQRVSSAAIVGFGEANHGTRESQVVRNQVITQLASKGLVDVIALEAGFAESLDLDRYVAGEAVDLRAAVQRLGFWMWRNNEFLQLAEAIRAHNARPGARRIRILGIDSQDPRVATAKLLADLAPLLGDELATLKSVLAPFAAENSYEAFTALSRDRQQEMVRTMELLAKRVPNDAPIELRWTARVAVQSVKLFQIEDLGEYDDARDGYLGENAAAVARDFGHGGMEVVLGHNSHVAAAPYRAGQSMGSILRKRLGARYVTVGFVVDTGSVTARPAGGKLATVELAPVDSPLYRLLRDVSRFDYYLDLERIHAEGTPWWMVPWPTREFGAIFRAADSMRSRRLPEHFNILVFLHKVTPIQVFPRN